MFCNIVLELWDKKHLREFLSDAQTGNLNPEVTPEKQAQRWWVLWCLNSARACRGKPRVTTASGVLQPAFQRQCMYTDNYCWQVPVPVLSLRDNLDTVKIV